MSTVDRGEKMQEQRTFNDVFMEFKSRLRHDILNANEEIERRRVEESAQEIIDSFERSIGLISTMDDLRRVRIVIGWQVLRYIRDILDHAFARRLDEIEDRLEEEEVSKAAQQ